MAGLVFCLLLRMIAASLFPTLKAVMPLSEKSNLVSRPSLFFSAHPKWAPHRRDLFADGGEATSFN